MVYDEVEQIKRGRYDPGGIVLRGDDPRTEARRACGDQLGWSFIGMAETIEGGYEGALGASSHCCCDDVKYPFMIKSPPEGR
jgi:hypothetical protein